MPIKLSELCLLGMDSATWAAGIIIIFCRVCLTTAACGISTPDQRLNRAMAVALES